MLKRLLFIVLFIPACIINSFYDVIMFVILGVNSECCQMLDWLCEKLLK